MKKSLLTLVGALAALPLAASAADYVLTDFSGFTPSYYGFGGSWSASTSRSDPSIFTIGDFGGGTPVNDGSFGVLLGASQDFSAYESITLTGSAFTGNATTDFAIYFEDIDGSAGNATFTVADFAGGTATVNLSPLFAMLDEAHVVAWGITTENQFGDTAFAFSFDQISLTLAPVAIPEPSTCAALAGVLGLATAALIRRRHAAV